MLETHTERLVIPLPLSHWLMFRLPLNSVLLPGHFIPSSYYNPPTLGDTIYPTPYFISIACPSLLPMRGAHLYTVCLAQPGIRYSLAAYLRISDYPPQSRGSVSAERKLVIDSYLGISRTPES